MTTLKGDDEKVKEKTTIGDVWGSLTDSQPHEINKEGFKKKAEQIYQTILTKIGLLLENFGNQILLKGKKVNYDPLAIAKEQILGSIDRITGKK